MFVYVADWFAFRNYFQLVFSCKRLLGLLPATICLQLMSSCRKCIVSPTKVIYMYLPSSYRLLSDVLLTRIRDELLLWCMSLLGVLYYYIDSVWVR